MCLVEVLLEGLVEAEVDFEVALGVDVRVEVKIEVMAEGKVDFNLKVGVHVVAWRLMLEAMIMLHASDRSSVFNSMMYMFQGLITRFLICMTKSCCCGRGE